MLPSDSPKQADAGIPPQYEFSPPQNRVIADLADAMTWVAVPLTFLGYLYIAALAFALIYAFAHPHAIPTTVAVFLTVVVYISLGRWFQKASESFQRIPATEGHDIDHLMEALQNLRKSFTLLSMLVKACLAVIVVGLVASLILLSVYGFRN